MESFFAFCLRTPLFTIKNLVKNTSGLRVWLDTILKRSREEISGCVLNKLNSFLVLGLLTASLRT